MKSFREQMIECESNGNQLREKCPQCGKDILTCKIFGGLCKSSKCKLFRKSGLVSLEEFERQHGITETRDDMGND